MIKIFILSIIAGAVSCGSSTTIAENVPPGPGSSPADLRSSDSKAPRNVVEEFMGLVSAGEVEKARTFLQKEPPVPHASIDPASPPEVGMGGEIKLDWIAYFRERDLRLHKVVGEEIVNGKATVKTELRLADFTDRTQTTVFHLTSDDGRWVISDIEFVFAKPSEIRLNSNVAGA